MRLNSAAVRQFMGLPDAKDVEVFAALRARKDCW